MLKIGWFSTGRGEGSRGLLSFIQGHITNGGLDANIEFVFSNREPGEAEGSDQFFQLAGEYGLPLECLSSARFAREQGKPFRQVRNAYDSRVMDRLVGYQPDVCVLAGYMLIISGPMCRQYPLLNLHPALPDGPIGTWQQVIWSLIENRTDLTGAMVHLATEEVDRGPVVSHCTVPISGERFAPYWTEVEGIDLESAKESLGEEFPLFRLIRESEYSKEPYLLLETLRAVSTGRVLVGPGEVRGPLSQVNQVLATNDARGLNLDSEIAQAMTRDGVAPEGQADFRP